MTKASKQASKQELRSEYPCVKRTKKSITVLASQTRVVACLELCEGIFTDRLTEFCVVKKDEFRRLLKASK